MTKWLPRPRDLGRALRKGRRQPARTLCVWACGPEREKVKEAILSLEKSNLVHATRHTWEKAITSRCSACGDVMRRAEI